MTLRKFADDIKLGLLKRSDESKTYSILFSTYLSNLTQLC